MDFGSAALRSGTRVSGDCADKSVRSRWPERRREEDAPTWFDCICFFSFFLLR
jgi:hypothetical protein